MCAAFAALLFASPAAADDLWLPHSANAAWTYQWTDTTYATTPTLEKVTVKSQTGAALRARVDDGRARQPGRRGRAPRERCRSRRRTPASSTPTGRALRRRRPSRCSARRSPSCGNALSSTLYNVIWGARQPVLAEPLLQGLDLDEHGRRRERRLEHVLVPRPREGRRAGIPERRRGGEGDVDDHPGRRARRPVRQRHAHDLVGVRRRPGEDRVRPHGRRSRTGDDAELQSTNQTPLPSPTDVDFFPLRKGKTLAFRWTNTKYLKKPEVDTVQHRRGRQRHGAPHAQVARPGRSRRRAPTASRSASTASRTSGATRRRPDEAPVPAPRAGRCSGRPTQPFRDRARPADVRHQPDAHPVSRSRRPLVDRPHSDDYSDVWRRRTSRSRRHADRAGARRHVPRARRDFDADAARLSVRQWHADVLVCRRGGSREARVRAPRRQCLDRRAAQVAP